MGQRGEVFSTRIFTDEGRKTFFFNVKENRYQDIYLNIVESRKTDTGFRRSSIVVFEENLEEFLTRLRGAAEALRQRRNPSGEGLSVGAGRRTYSFRKPFKGRPAMMITEERQDSTGTRRETIMIPLNGLDDFFKGLDEAVSAMTSTGESSIRGN